MAQKPHWTDIERYSDGRISSIANGQLWLSESQKNDPLQLLCDLCESVLKFQNDHNILNSISNRVNLVDKLTGGVVSLPSGEETDLRNIAYTLRMAVNDQQTKIAGV